METHKYFIHSNTWVSETFKHCNFSSGSGDELSEGDELSSTDDILQWTTDDIDQWNGVPPTQEFAEEELDDLFRSKTWKSNTQSLIPHAMKILQVYPALAQKGFFFSNGKYAKFTTIYFWCNRFCSNFGGVPEILNFELFSIL